MTTLGSLSHSFSLSLSTKVESERFSIVIAEATSASCSDQPVQRRRRMSLIDGKSSNLENTSK